METTQKARKREGKNEEGMVSSGCAAEKTAGSKTEASAGFRTIGVSVFPIVSRKSWEQK